MCMVLSTLVKGNFVGLKAFFTWCCINFRQGKTKFEQKASGEDRDKKDKCTT